MRNPRKKIESLKQQLHHLELKHESLLETLRPLVASGQCLLDLKHYVDKMFIETVKNAPDDEIDNYTARDFAPYFYNLSYGLMAMYKNPELYKWNVETTLISGFH